MTFRFYPPADGKPGDALHFGSSWLNFPNDCKHACIRSGSWAVACCGCHRGYIATACIVCLHREELK